DVDPCVEQLEHILPPLGVAALGRVRVRELVDQQQRGMPRQRRVEVEFLELGAAVLDTAPRKNLQALQEGSGLRTVMRLDDAGDDVYAGHALGARRLEHRVGLADARGGAEEDLQLAARPARLLLSDAKEELVGIGPSIRHAAMSVPPETPAAVAL